MTAPRKPHYSDLHRFPHGPYADAKASSEPGYLAERFRVIREAQARDAAEAKAKVATMKRATK